MGGGTDWLRGQAKRISSTNELPVSTAQAARVEVESWLQRHDVAYAPPTDIPMALIDERRSRANQARRDAIVTESVDRFATAMRSGAVFPPIVVYANGGKLVIIDGNNRQAAARKAGLDTVHGIVIAEDTPSELIQLLTVEANAHHGVTPELSWRLQQAFHLCALGFTDAQAAEAASVSAQQIRTARQVKDADERAKARKIVGFGELPATSRQALGALRDDAVFFQAARVAIDTGMTIEELREMTRAVKALTSEGARIEYIGTVAKERGIEAATRKATGKVLRRVSSPKTALASGIGLLMKVDTASLIRQVVTTHDRDLLRERVSALETKVLELMCALDQLKDMDDR